MADKLVRLEQNGPIATVLFDNPPVNAASVALIEDLHAALDAIESNRSIRCVILSGAGSKAFCAGADLRQEKEFRDPEASRRFRELGRRTLERIETFSRPIIAAIHGYCIGGGTALAWACDIRIAADNAVFRAGDAYLGVIPSWGMGLLRLPRLLGRARVLDVLLLGENFGAARACDLGLVSEVVARAELETRSGQVAARIASASPTAILAIRKAVNFNLRHPWEAMAAYEEELSAQVFADPDSEEGMAAFLEKRRPQFHDL